MKLRLEQIQDPSEWAGALQKLKHPHLLQSWEWGAFKGSYKWKPARLLWSDLDGRPAAAAQVLFRSEAPGLTMGYCPRGPLLDWGNVELRQQVLLDLRTFALKQGAFVLKIDPALVSSVTPSNASPIQPQPGLTAVEDTLLQQGWRLSAEQVQFRNTFVLDLDPGEETLLANMKQKTRYNIRLAARKGVTIRRGSLEDVDLLYRVFAETSLRDGFVIREPAYYQRAWGNFFVHELAQPFIAEVDGQPVSAIIIFRYMDDAYYLYGMSRELHREKMPNYLLQWEAIRWAKQMGCRLYDFWGAPDEIDEADPMYGVYRFKEGFGAVLVETPGAWDLPLRPVLFSSYRMLMPRILAVMRILGRSATRQQLEN